MIRSTTKMRLKPEMCFLEIRQYSRWLSSHFPDIRRNVMDIFLLCGLAFVVKQKSFA